MPNLNVIPLDNYSIERANCFVHWCREKAENGSTILEEEIVEGFISRLREIKNETGISTKALLFFLKLRDFNYNVSDLIKKERYELSRIIYMCS